MRESGGFGVIVYCSDYHYSSPTPCPRIADGSWEDFEHRTARRVQSPSEAAGRRAGRLSNDAIMIVAGGKIRPQPSVFMVAGCRREADN